MIVGLLGVGLIVFSFLLPGHSSTEAAPAPSETVEGEAPVDVTKSRPPSPEPEPPPPPREGPDCSTVACVALTFDDGPSAHSQALLDKLAELNVKATFFNTGKNTKNQPGAVRRQADEGHALGGHSWNHADMNKRAAAEACADAQETAAAIRDASGVETILVRPPYGSWNDAVLNACAGMAFILWDVDTMDWSNHDVAKITAHAVNDSKPGSIVLMHDTVAETIEALPGIVAGLRDKGYQLVTVHKMWKEPIAPGQAIYNGPRPG
ncbi:MAG: polysaccharide deacetylase family protein [Bifidobacteriaceae bacterium]|nr:polysaccharide deacetylase family protein [Bifidobacteriaceae bacterium]